MRWVAFAVVPLVGALLVGCASADGPTDQQPRSPRHTPPRGSHSVSYHGVSVDVPDTTRLTEGPACDPALPATGDLVVPLFFAGATRCPGHPDAADRTPAPRPADVLTVVLGETGARSTSTLTDPRHADVPAAGVTVTASGPAAVVDAVLASVRVTPQDDHGCVDRIDASVAPRNIDSPDGSLLPVATSRIVVCEYGETGDAANSHAAQTTLWLVGSAELREDVTSDVDTRLRAATTADTGGTTSSGPVLRLLVLGADGNTRTLQSTTTTSPQPVTDGRRTVAVDTLTDGTYAALPTPFDAA